MTKVLSQSVAVSLIAVLAISAVIAGLAANSASATTEPGRFLVTLHPTREDALPGDTIGWILELTNSTGVTQTDVMVQKAITHNDEGVEYLTRSGVMKLSSESKSQFLDDEWGWQKSILTAKPFELRNGESLLVEWKETATGDVLNDWVQTSVKVTTADLKEIPVVYRSIYMVDPNLKINKHFTAAMGANTATVQPGGKIDYTVLIENDGNVRIDNIVVNADLPNGADQQWVEYISGSASYSIDGVAGKDTVKDGWVGRDTGFNLNYLNPGQTLAFTYSVRVDEEAPHGLTLNSIANIRPQTGTKWTQVAANTTVTVPGEAPVGPDGPDGPGGTTDGPRPGPGTTGGSTGTLPGAIPEYGGVSAVAMALWLTSAAGLTGVAFRAGRKTILG